MLIDSLAHMQIDYNTGTVSGVCQYQCPYCDAHRLRKNGFARRTIKTVTEAGTVTDVLYVQCYVCSNCRRHTRLIPSEWYPYRRYTVSAVSFVLGTKYSVNTPTLNRFRARVKSREFVTMRT